MLAGRGTRGVEPSASGEGGDEHTSVPSVRTMTKHLVSGKLGFRPTLTRSTPAAHHKRSDARLSELEERGCALAHAR